MSSPSQGSDAVLYIRVECGSWRLGMMTANGTQSGNDLTCQRYSLYGYNWKIEDTEIVIGEINNEKKMTTCKRTHFLALFLLVVIMISSCDKKIPVRIGFVGGLTGRLSDLGIAGRNGAQLAIENINRSGGIKGRQVELIIKNDEQNAEIALKVAQELINENVVAIIGHMTSSMSLAVLPLINENSIVMVSPTTSTNKLTDIDDYFFRVIPPNRSEIEHLTKVANKDLGLSEIAVIYDISNKGFTEGWYNAFKNEFENRGGQVVKTVSFTSSKNTSLLEIAEEITATKPAGLVIIAGALDAAGICQQIQKLGHTLPIFSTGWALSEEFIRQGGTAVNNVIFSQIYNKQSQNKLFLEFKRNFVQRFGREPDFGSALAYEATQIVLDALIRVKETGNLKQAILERQSYNGLQGDITFGKYGDVERQRILVTVKNRQFSVID